jgi:uncharacterized membrane protein YqgA involved in biofilm formation
MIMTGTILNALGILVGGVLGLTLRKQMSHATQVGIKSALGVLVIFVGLKTTWTSLGGGLWPVLKQLLIVVLALMAGRLTGRLLHLQKGLNRLGQYARERFTKTASAAASDTSNANAPQTPAPPNRWGEGFITCTILFCVGPMALLGAIQDGLSGRWQILGAKALMDGLATMAFVGTFGWGAICSVVPVVAYQGTVTLAAQWLAPAVSDQALMNSINATGGLLVFCIAMIILELRKFDVADYLPSLFFAPLITWLWR